MINSEEIIPLNNAIQSFGKHLSAHQRTILSAKFGDGKSYFLNAISKDSALATQYEFITLYPVNYQVESNKDIFEYIKRDILFQLSLKNMIDSSIELSKGELLQWFIIYKGGDLLTDLLPSLSAIGLPPEVSSKVTMGLLGLSIFKNLSGEYTKFKKDFEINHEKIIETYPKIRNRQQGAMFRPL